MSVSELVHRTTVDTGSFPIHSSLSPMEVFTGTARTVNAVHENLKQLMVYISLEPARGSSLFQYAHNSFLLFEYWVFCIFLLLTTFSNSGKSSISVDA